MKEIEVDLDVLRFFFNVLKEQGLSENEIQEDLCFRAKEYLSPHSSNTLKCTEIYKTYTTYQFSWKQHKQNPRVINSIQLSTNEKEKYAFLCKLLIASKHSFHRKLLYEFYGIDKYQRKKNG